MTTPKSLPAHRARLASKTQLASETAAPSETNGASIACAVHGGSPEPPHTKQAGSGTTTTPKALLAARRSCHYRPSETAVPSETRGPVTANAVRSQPQARAVTPRFYPVFTPLCSVFTPLFPRFYPVPLRRFTPFLPRFYPVFPPFRSVVFTPVLPLFYPICEG